MKSNTDWGLILKITICVLVGLLVVSLMALEVYCGIKYADTPVSELPAWVAWILLK